MMQHNFEYKKSIDLKFNVITSESILKIMKEALHDIAVYEPTDISKKKLKIDMNLQEEAINNKFTVLFSGYWSDNDVEVNVAIKDKCINFANIFSSFTFNENIKNMTTEKVLSILKSHL